MPRIAPVAIRKALRIDRHLPRLLTECQDIHSAQNELRWMKESILEQTIGNNHNEYTLAHSRIWSDSNSTGQQLRTYVRRRARGEPLQYILGTQPFGELTIKCRPLVLIPRGETEIYTMEVAKILHDMHGRKVYRDLTIVDFCSGTGCIALLLHSLLRSQDGQAHTTRLQNLSITGFDISQHALRLARENQRHNLTLKTLHDDAASEVQFNQLDVLQLGSKSMSEISCQLSATICDVVISNPPYISPQHFVVGGPTSRSVRKFEPELALVPPARLVFESVLQADQFYVALIRIALATKAKMLVMEVGDNSQASRVRELCKDMLHFVDQDFAGPQKVLIEVWRDDGSVVLDDESIPHPAARSNSGEDEAEDYAEARVVTVWFDREWIAHRSQQRLARI